jgi:UDP:flavonoid glycosyltransferase YjiC (YdhE family)
LIPLAAAIRAQGHEAVFATSESARAGLAVHGLELEPCGPNWRESDFGRSAAPYHALADLPPFLATEVEPRMLFDLDTAVRRRRPDVILSDDFEPVGQTVAEKHGIPFVLASHGPRLKRRVREERHGALVRGVRKLAGLSETGGLDYALRWLHLCFAPREWAFGGSVHGAHRPHIEAANEFGICPRIADLGVPPAPEAGALGGARPAALCTFGTIFNKRADILRTVVRAVAPRVARLVVVLGPGADATHLGAIPANVEVHAEAPTSRFLPHVDYVITHAGAGTLTALQLHGKPSLLLPQGADQPINAAACRRIGISVVRFHTAASVIVGVPPGEPMTDTSVAQAFDELTADDGYRARAEAFGAAFRNLPPLEHAVALIERLARTRAPVLRPLVVNA